jgi:hypothetical protein
MKRHHLIEPHTSPSSYVGSVVVLSRRAGPAKFWWNQNLLPPSAHARRGNKKIRFTSETSWEFSSLTRREKGRPDLSPRAQHVGERSIKNFIKIFYQWKQSMMINALSYFQWLHHLWYSAYNHWMMYHSMMKSLKLSMMSSLIAKG